MTCNVYLLIEPEIQKYLKNKKVKNGTNEKEYKSCSV